MTLEFMQTKKDTESTESLSSYRRKYTGNRKHGI